MDTTAPPIAPEPVAPDVASPEDLRVLEGRRGRRWRWIGLAVALLAAVVAGAAWYRAGAEPRSAWETVPVRSGDLVRRVTAVGKLEPVEHVEVGSDLGGKVVEVLVDENDRVTAGQVLARIDPEPYEAATTQARAAVASATAALRRAEVEQKDAERDLARTKKLVQGGAAPSVDLETAQFARDAAVASVDAAAASLEQAKATLDRAEQDLGEAVIRSPIDGVVLRRMIEPGQTVVSAFTATPLFDVASDIQALELEVDVDEADIGQVAPGQRATFTVSAWPDKTFGGTVTSVDIAADESQSVVVYGTHLEVDNREGLLRPDMTATAEIEVGGIEGLLVPTEALRFRPSGVEDADVPKVDHVWTLRDDEPAAVPVKVEGSDGPTTAISGEGVREGMPVLVGGEA